MTEEQTYIVRLYFSKSIRIGSAKSGIGIESVQDFIHSDTLWAAIANYWSLIGKAGDLTFDDFLNGFRMKTALGNESVSEPLFTMSSAFPFTLSGRKRIYWLPKPRSVPFCLSVDNAINRAEQKKKYGKIFRHARFISKDVFMKWLAFNSEFGSSIEIEEMIGISSRSLRPQAAIDRPSNKAMLYHTGLTYIEHQNKSFGLYWLFKTADKRVEQALKEVLDVIRDAGGIGGNISSGCGELYHYEISKADDSWNFLHTTSDANACCLLSLCYPLADERSLMNPIAADLVIRKGWTGSLVTGLRKKRQTISMIAEGSVFAKSMQGGIADVTPDPVKTPEWRGFHPVLRYGYAFTVPIKLNFKD